MGKKPWQTPQLIVLVRSRPEEAVLTTCKGTAFGPTQYVSSCQQIEGNCLACQSLLGS